MKKFLIIFFLCIFTLTAYAQDESGLTLEAKCAIELLKKTKLLTEDFDFSSNPTRIEYLTMLIKIDNFTSAESNSIDIVLAEDTVSKYSDVKELSDEQKCIIAEADLKGILKGRAFENVVLAEPHSKIAWREALIFSLRMVTNFDRDFYENDDQRLLDVSQNYGLIDYTLCDLSNLSWLDETLSYDKACILTYRLLHAPAKRNAFGGEYTKYYIDDYIF